MKIYDIIWRDKFVEKLVIKHGVLLNEVEEVLFGSPFVRFSEKGDVDGENLYVAYGQTRSGRYLTIFFIKRLNHCLWQWKK